MQSMNQSSSVSNDRLRKAIERNKARQEKRDQVKSGSNDRRSKIEPSLFSNSSFESKPKIVRPGATRTGVARADTLQFSSKIESRVNKFSDDNIAYKSTSKRSIKRSPKKISSFKNFSMGGTKLGKKKRSKLILKVGWAICFALSLRLILTDGGVWDYLKQDERIAQIKSDIKVIKNDNKSLLKELKLIKTSRVYRKELVRKHLGFISSDEYLVLFAENNLNN